MNREKSISPEKIVVFKQMIGKIIKNFGKKRVLNKNSCHFWKIRPRVIVLCIYLNFDFSDENWLFLNGEGVLIFSIPTFSCILREHEKIQFNLSLLRSVIKITCVQDLNSLLIAIEKIFLWTHDMIFVV
jgi:hypothetical protein